MEAVTLIDLNTIVELWISSACVGDDTCSHITRISLRNGLEQRVTLKAPEIAVLIKSVAPDRIAYGGGWGKIEAIPHFIRYFGECKTLAAEIVTRIFTPKK